MQRMSEGCPSVTCFTQRRGKDRAFKAKGFLAAYEVVKKKVCRREGGRDNEKEKMREEQRGKERERLLLELRSQVTEEDSVASLRSG